MKGIAHVLLALSVPLCSASGQQRYLNEIFPSVSIREGVQYGSNINNVGQMMTLLMDYFQPVGDSIARRPVIIFVHGGAYISGSRTDSKVREFCTRFSRRGYITSSIDYRLGVANLLSRTDFILAAYRGMQDAKASVRYFRRPEVADSLRVDTTKIFLGGFSAGAFSALNAACLEVSELPPEIDTTQLGNIEGNSGNPGHSSSVLALMNCWGGLFDTLFIDPGDIPVISVHGTADPVVPYSSGISIFAGIYLYGSATINARLRSLGIGSYLIPMPGVGHGFPSDPTQNSFWTDTTIVSTAAFFFPFVQPTAVAPVAHQQPEKLFLEQNFPNPFNPSTTIRYSLVITAHVRLTVFDVIGHEVRTLVDGVRQPGKKSVVWDGRDNSGRAVSSGVYLYRLAAGGPVLTNKLILLR
jgi:acetyl esterase/lipase